MLEELAGPHHAGDGVVEAESVVENCLEATLEVTIDARPVEEMAHPPQLQSNRRRDEVLFVFEVAEDGTLRHAGEVGDASHGRLDIADLVQRKQCFDHRVLVAFTANPTSVGTRGDVRRRRRFGGGHGRILGRRHGDTISAVTMPNIPCGPSAWLRMWQCQAHTPGSTPL